MTIGILKLEIFFQDSKSLKDKRMVLHSIKARLRNGFNVSVTQIDDEDKWQKSTLAVVGVQKNRNNMNRILSNIVNYIEGFKSVHLIDYEMEMI
ncbi:MAG: DUF503 domain-containing protein [Deltaproteobacteria bacterium]